MPRIEDGLDMTTPGVNATLTLGEEEIEIETVIVILWVSGGFLLVTLVSLLACILRSHKKARDLRNHRNGSRADGRLRNGGINPAFTTYDEIWTWIPVMRGNQADCTAQIEPSALHNSNPSSTTSRDRPLRPPSYHEATSGSNSRLPNPGPACSIATIAQLCANINSPTTTRRETVVPQTEVPRSGTSSNAQQNASTGESTQRYISTVAVTPSAHLNPQDRGASRQTNSRPNVTSRNNRRDRTCQLQRYTRIDETGRPNRQTTQQQNTTTSSSRHNAPMPTPQNNANDHSRQTNRSSATYQVENGVYTYQTGTNGRRVWCDIPPCLIDEDGPPPYTPYPDYPRSERSSVGSQGQTGQAPLMRLDIDYF